MDRQKQRAFLYGGNLLLIVGWIAVWLLSYIDQTQYPWAYRVVKSGSCWINGLGMR